MPDNNLYLIDAVKRLGQGLESLNDSAGDPIIEAVQLYLEPYPTGSNWVCLHPFGLTREEKPAGAPFKEQTWGINARVGVGNLGQEYGGIQQAKLWERLPVITNWITEHPHLQFAGATSLLTYLDTTIGVSVQPGATRSRIERLETGNFIWSELTVQIPFRVPMNVIKYQDGQEIEVN